MRLTVFFVLLMVGADAFANNLFIPNYYKGRRAPNSFSAIGWSDRKEAGGEISRVIEEKERGGQADSEDSSTTIAPHIYYRTPVNVNIEASLLSLKGEVEDKSTTPSTTDDRKGLVQNIGVGYEMPDLPVALGVSYFNSQIETEDGTTHVTTKNKTTIAGVGAGYRLADNYFVGIGLFETKLKFGTTTEYHSDALYVGGGKVFGDLKNPDAAMETTLKYLNMLNSKTYELTVSGLYNQGSFQHYGSIAYETTGGEEKNISHSTQWELVIGSDLEFGNFFVGPQIEYITEKTGDPATTDDKSTELSLEGGYRAERFEVVAGYGVKKFKEDYSNASKDYEGDTKEITLGAVYKF